MSLGLAAPASAAIGVPVLENKSNGQGGTTPIAVIRVTLFELYGAWPQGFEPTATRPIPKGTDQLLPIDSDDQGFYAAKLYWRWNSATRLFEPKVSILFNASLTPEEVIDGGPIDLDINSPTGAPFRTPSGDPIINPITFTPVEEVSPTLTGPFSS